jgi:dGTPase
MVGKQLLQKHPHLATTEGYTFNDFGSIVAAAALAHDIGNPPFGHSGEKAIGAFFSNGWGAQFKKNLSAQEYQELVDFEGNANGFRILNKDRAGVPGGLRLSYATLGAFTKYPKTALPKKPTPHIAHKKYGVFKGEQTLFEDIALELGLIDPKGKKPFHYLRHPLAFLVEAADDICYTIIDFEDGINLGLIPEDFALEYLIKLVKDSINTDKYHAMVYREDRISYLRALAINTLISDAIRVFMENEEAILDGSFNCSLLDKSHYKAQIADIISLSVEKVYKSSEVIEKEVSGYRIISDLLTVFVKALLNDSNSEATAYDQLILALIPGQYREQKNSLYEILMGCSCFIASLSDRAAIQLHHKISGKIA